MRNFIQPGRTVTIPAPSNVVSGQFVGVGQLFGVSASDAASGAPMDLVTEGVFELPKESAAVLTVGAYAYWNGAALDVESTGADQAIGVIVEAAGSGATTAKVRFSGAF